MAPGWFQTFLEIQIQTENRQPRISQDTIALIRRIAAENPLWGAERIKGELKKLGIKVAKRTLHKYMRQARPAHPPSQNWRTFLKNHATQVWACDFLPVTDIFFRQLYAFVIVGLSSRKIIHIGVPDIQLMSGQLNSYGKPLRLSSGRNI